METKRDLSGLRNEVRELDKELVKLFEKRMHLCRLIGEYKLKAEVPIYDARREEENIEQVVSVIQKTIDKSHFIKWYRLLMDISKRVQQSIQKRNGI